MLPDRDADIALEALLHGRDVGDEYRTLRTLGDDLRLATRGPAPVPSPALATLLAGRAAAGVRWTSRVAAGAGIAAKLAFGTAAAVAGIATADVAGVLPRPVADMVRPVIELVLPIELPGHHDTDAPAGDPAVEGVMSADGGSAPTTTPTTGGDSTAGDQGQGSSPTDPPDQSNAPGQADGQDQSGDAQGQSEPQGQANAQGQSGDAQGQSEPRGQANGQDQSGDAQGQSEPQSQANAQGQSNTRSSPPRPTGGSPAQSNPSGQSGGAPKQYHPPEPAGSSGQWHVEQNAPGPQPDQEYAWWSDQPGRPQPSGPAGRPYPLEPDGPGAWSGAGHVDEHR